jgi:hypothetical protein
MEEAHRTHKEVPSGYWAVWVVPVWKFLTRRWPDRQDCDLPAGTDQLSAPH